MLVTQEMTRETQSCLRDLRNIADGLERMLERSDEYWTWAGFFKDMKDELLRVKDHAEDAGRTLENNLETLRETELDPESEQLLKRIDKKRDDLERKGKSITDKADISTVALEGEHLASDLRETLHLFRETSDLVEELLNRVE